MPAETFRFQTGLTLNFLKYIFSIFFSNLSIMEQIVFASGDF